MGAEHDHVQHTTDQAVQKVLDGNIDAFEDVIRLHDVILRAWLAARCPPEIDERDIAQRAFVKSFHLLGSYSQGTDFRSWLFTIARNLLLAECKSKRNQMEGTRRYIDIAVCRARERELADESSEPDSRMAALAECLNELGPPARRIVENRYTHDLGLAEIARQLGRSVGAIKKSLFVIRRRLHECIGRKIESQEAGI